MRTYVFDRSSASFYLHLLAWKAPNDIREDYGRRHEASRFVGKSRILAVSFQMLPVRASA